jgi:hypothetical protein
MLTKGPVFGVLNGEVDRLFFGFSCWRKLAQNVRISSWGEGLHFLEKQGFTSVPFQMKRNRKR